MNSASQQWGNNQDINYPLSAAVNRTSFYSLSVLRERMPDKIIVFQSLLKGNTAAQISIVYHNTEFCLESSAALLVHQLLMLHISHV